MSCAQNQSLHYTWFAPSDEAHLASRLGQNSGWHSQGFSDWSEFESCNVVDLKEAAALQ